MSKTIPPVGGLKREVGPRGRMAALAILDEILSLETNKKKIREALQEQLALHPFWFFQNVVVPLLPKERDIFVSTGEGRTHLTPDQVVQTMDTLTAGTSIDKRGRVLAQEFVDKQNRPKTTTIEEKTQVARVKVPTRVRV